jgi:VanZ family protein
MKKIFRSIYPSIIWTGIIFWLLSLDTPHYDKIIHLGIFFLFSIFWGYFTGHGKEKIKLGTALLIFLSGSFYGMVMEYYQLYFTNRSFSWWDGLADALGTAIGLIWVIKKPLWK